MLVTCIISGKKTGPTQIASDWPHVLQAGLLCREDRQARPAQAALAYCLVTNNAVARIVTHWPVQHFAVTCERHSRRRLRCTGSRTRLAASVESSASTRAGRQAGQRWLAVQHAPCSPVSMNLLKPRHGVSLRQPWQPCQA